MTIQENERLKELALRVRGHIVRMSGNGGCFIGASLSCADIMTYLYNGFLNIAPDRTEDPNRDFFFLSKGHDVPALYGVFAELGYIERARLTNHLSPDDSIYWHPNRNVPGVEFHSGSLGHLPAVSIGVALEVRLRGGDNRVIVLTGDGELDEGSVWEALLVASAFKLNNWTLVVDRNHFQANVKTEELIPLEPLAAKFEAFGCSVRRINGHDFNQLDETFRALPFHTEKPSVIICDTIRGQGLPSISERTDRWFCNFSDNEVDQLLDELNGKDGANIISETLTVR